ncbi:ArgE/DapE family deacylase [Kordiimonas marina]|uniref:ArgE/DapE family deacylase n=1 Tax=Kordiimonas marina TaxID=2872312 RepID=UPI001FF54982|nr:ArgE/DapE family deacylase [Kordiimonas marina]MCJ9430079.1 ArgE/DapE family deacylase [Kordiimonas marina]
MISETEQKILDACDQIFPRVIDFTKAMVSEYGVLNQEAGVLDVVEREMADLKLPVTRVPIDEKRLGGHPLFAPVEWGYDKKYNLVSPINPGAKGRSLVLNGHLDVVPASPEGMWQRPPNEPWEKDGWLYGRGAGDMQSGVAAMIYAVHALAEAGVDIKSPLTIQAVVEEECTGNGALACLERGYDGDFVLIPEPFGPSLYAGQVGVLWFKVGIEGTPVHVLDTSAGDNAIQKLQLLIPFLEDLEAELNEKHRTPPYDRFDHPFNLNIGKIAGGNWASSVPSYAEMEGRIGFPPGMTANEIMQKVNDCIEAASARLPAFKDKKPKLRFHGFRSEGHLIDLKDPGIKMLSSCHHALLGAEPELFYATCTTDLRAFHFYNKTAGTCYGPVAKRIHGVDECVDIESIRHTLKTYALFISRWCDIGQS